MNTFAFIESNTSGTGHLFAKKALQKGLRVLFLSKDPSRYPYLSKELIHPLTLDSHNPKALLEALRTEPDLAGVFSSSEYFLETAAFCARECGLPGAQPEAIALCRNKERLAETLQKAGISVPITTVVTNLEQARAALAEMPFPLVVKPLMGSGSIDVAFHSDQNTCLMHIGRLLEKKTNERGQPVEPRCLVQSYAEGDEYSIEVISRNGVHQVLGITRKYLGSPPAFLETAHDFPASLKEKDRIVLENEVLRALDETGYDFGPSHTEVRLAKGKATIIEINPRLAGGMIPVLMEQVLGGDLLDQILDLYLGKTVSFDHCPVGGASISFVIPKNNGILQAVHTDSDLSVSPNLVAYHMQAQPGARIQLRGDFRDRIGHIITKGASVGESRAHGDRLLQQIHPVLESQQPKNPTSQDTGRIKKTLHPEALSIVRVPPPTKEMRQELHLLAAVDEAHLLMCAQQGILSVQKIQPVLEEIQRLKSGDFAVFDGVVAPRGSYYLYEDAIVKKLGPQVGGVTHIARSRNDINAALFRMHLREPFMRAYGSLWRLRSALLTQAAKTLDLAMPIYSQFQPGMPGTLAHYLLGVQQALGRDQKGLIALEEDLDHSPLGAGAGCGTSFPIDAQMTARLLGFKSVCANALDAVASRDLALRFLGAVAISGMTLSRLAQDLQLWTTQEFHFFDLPDQLTGGSSMLPQKKNPYLLEMIKGRAIAPSGTLTAALATMQKVPFSNSVEVGTEALSGLTQAISSFAEAADLLRLIIEAMSPNPNAMVQAADRGLVIASSLADQWVQKEGIPFRQAHHKVGAVIRKAMEAGEDPAQALRQQFGNKEMGSESLLTYAHLFEFGGGPGKQATAKNLRRAGLELHRNSIWIRGVKATWSEAEILRENLVYAQFASSPTKDA